MANADPQHRPNGRYWTNPDHVGGLVWFLFGAALLYGSWTMDRLESQNINPVTAPGLLPGLIAVGIIAFALVLLFRRSIPQVHSFFDGVVPAGEPQQPRQDWKRLAVSWFLCVGFAGALLGRGLPFWLLAGLFVFLHIVLLDDPDRIAEQPLAKRAMTAAIVAICTATIVTVVFQKIFLVRLP